MEHLEKPVPETRTPEASAQKAPKHVFSAEEKWLLLGALILGVLFRTLWSFETLWAYSAFWAAYAVLFLIWQWKRAKNNRTAWLVLGAAAAMMVLLPYQAWLDDLGGMIFAAILAIPCLLMLHAVLVLYDVPVGREGMAVQGMVRGFFVLPFASIGRFFGAIGALAAGADHQKRRARQALLGLAIGVPLLIVVLVLLSRADARMAGLIAGAFDNWDVGEWLGTLIVVLVTAMLVYSFLHGGKYRLPALRALPDGCWSAATLGVIEALPLAAYALFLGLQFSYLFGGTLPEAYTYSEYARAGFGELIVVSLINFLLLALSVRYGEKHAVLSLLNGLLLLANAPLLVSAALRLLMYIDAYGLTIMRILPLWLMVFLAFLTVLTALRLWRGRLPLVRIAAITFLYWLAALYVPNWGNIILAFNAAH